MLDSIVICVVRTGHLYIGIGQSAISYKYRIWVDPRKQNNKYEEKKNGLSDEERKSVIRFQSAQY